MNASTAIARAGNGPILQLEQAIRQQSSLTAQLLRLTKVSLKQFYSLDDLRDRWCCGRDQAIALIAEHAGYRGEPGRTPSIHLDDVLKIDEILRDSYIAERQAKAVRHGG